MEEKGTHFLRERFWKGMNEMKSLYSNEDVDYSQMNTVKLSIQSKNQMSESAEPSVLAEKMTELGLFNPSGKYMVWWDTFTIFAILYSVFAVPIEIAFLADLPPSAAIDGIDYAITAIFFADTLVTFNVPFFNRADDTMVFSRWEIGKRYASFWLWVDLAAAFPFGDILLAAEGSASTSKGNLQSIKLIRIVRLVRLTKLYKLFKYGHVKEMLNDQNISPAFVSSVILLFQVGFAAHLIACFWYFITLPIATGADDKYSIRTWANTYSYISDDINSSTLYTDGDTTSQYMIALFWTYTTLFTVGYGDTHATNTGERFYSTLVELFAAVVFGTVISRVKSVVESQNVNGKHLRHLMAEFKDFLEEKRITQAIKIDAKDAYAYYLQKVPSLCEGTFYHELPRLLKFKFVGHKFFREIQHIAFFRNTDISVLSNLLIYYKPQQARMGEVIYDGGDFAEEMAFLTKGTVRLLTREGVDEVMLGVATSGNYFGDFEYFIRTTRVCRYKAVQNCSLFAIGYNRFNDALEGNEKAKMKIKKILRRRYINLQEVKASPLVIPIPSLTTPIELTAEANVITHEDLWLDGEKKQLVGGEEIDQSLTIGQKLQHLNIGSYEVKPKFNFLVLNSQGEECIQEHSADFLKPLFLIHPMDEYKTMWDALIGLLICFSIIVIPIQLAFDSFNSANGDQFTALEYCWDLLFAGDIIFSFNTAYFSETDDAFVTIRKKITKNYLQSWFIVDVLSSFPFELAVSAGGTSTGGNLSIIQLVKILRMLRILKLLKIINFTALTNNLEDRFNISASTVSLAYTLTQVIFICHLVTCMWWGITSSINGPHWYDYIPQTFDALGPAPLQQQYVAAFYWTMTTLTTTGYGDLVPITSNERICCVFILVGGATVFSYIVANISDIMGGSNQSEALAAQKLTAIKELLADSKVPQHMFGEIVGHFKTAMKHSCAYDEHALLRRLPIRVRNKLQLFINRKTLETIPLFHYLESDSLKIFILSKMRFQVCDTGNYFFKEEDEAHEVFFLKSGVAELRRAILSENEKKAKEKLKKGGAATMLERLKAQVNLEEGEEGEASQIGTDDDGEEAKIMGADENNVKMPSAIQSLDRLDEDSGDDDASIVDTQKRLSRPPRRLSKLNISDSTDHHLSSNRDGGKSPPVVRGSVTITKGEADLAVYSRKSSTKDAALPVGLTAHHEFSDVVVDGEGKTHAEKQANQKWDSVMIGVQQQLSTGYRVSQAAKARWLLVRENLGAIVKMGLNMVKREKFLTIGTLKAGEFIGHQECNDNAEFSYSLVATEECSFYVLQMDLVTALSVDFPDVAMQLESALAHCIMAQEREHALRAWKKRNLGFIEEIKDNLAKDKYDIHMDAKATAGGRVFFNANASGTRHRRKKGRNDSLTPSDYSNGEGTGVVRDDKVLTGYGRIKDNRRNARHSLDGAVRSRPTSAKNTGSSSKYLQSHKIAASSGTQTPQHETDRAIMSPDPPMSSRTDPPAMDDSNWELRSNVSSEAINDMDNMGTMTFQRAKDGYEPPPLGFLTKPEKLALQMKKASRLLELYESRNPQVEEKIRKQSFGGLITRKNILNANKKTFNGSFKIFPTLAHPIFTKASAFVTKQVQPSSSTIERPAFIRQRGMSKMQVPKELKSKKRKDVHRKNHRSYADALTVARAQKDIWKNKLTEKALPTRRYSF